MQEYDQVGAPPTNHQAEQAVSANDHSAAERYVDLAERARGAGMEDLANRLRQHAAELRLSEAAFAETFIAESVTHAQAKIQRLLHTGAAGEDATIYTGVERGSITEETLKRLFRMLGTPDLRTLKPAERPGSPGEEQRTDLEVAHDYDTGWGIALRLTAVAIDDTGPRVLELEAVKK